MNFPQQGPAEFIAEIERAGTRRATPAGQGEIVWRVFGRGEPLVLLHGGTGSWLHWVRNIEVLSADFMLLVPDIPGSGESGNPAPQFGKLPPTGEWTPASPGREPVAVEFPRGAAVMARVFFIKAIRQIDARYGQFGCDADLAAEIRRASRKILLIPAARVQHRGRDAGAGSHRLR